MARPSKGMELAQGDTPGVETGYTRDGIEAAFSLVNG